MNLEMSEISDYYPSPDEIDSFSQHCLGLTPAQIIEAIRKDRGDQAWSEYTWNSKLTSVVEGIHIGFDRVQWL